MSAAITGIGETPFSKAEEPSAPSHEKTIESARLAAVDAGITTHEIDGIIKYSVDGAMSDTELATQLGVRDLRFSAEIPYGGGSAAAGLTAAALAVDAGIATNVLCYRTVVAAEWASQLSRPDPARPFYREAREFLRPIGWYGYLHLFGMLTHRHMCDYGTRPEQFAEVVVNARGHGEQSPNALGGDAITVDDYLASPATVEPLRILDDAIWANGSCAVIVTRRDRAQEAPTGAAHILTTGQSTGSPPQVSFEFWPIRENLNSAMENIATDLWSRGVGPSDVGSLQCYDTTPVSVLLALEGLGFCGRGESGAFVEDGNVADGGSLAVCTNGGHTGGAYIHGFSQLVEAVRRVRGVGTSERDDFAVVSGAPTTPTSAALLGAEPLD